MHKWKELPEHTNCLQMPWMGKQMLLWFHGAVFAFCVHWIFKKILDRTVCKWIQLIFYLWPGEFQLEWEEICQYKKMRIDRNGMNYLFLFREMKRMRLKSEHKEVDIWIPEICFMVEPLWNLHVSLSVLNFRHQS